MADVAGTVELNDDFINDLLAGARTKGAGDQVLEDFLAKGVKAVEVVLTSGPLAGKTAAQAATTITNAKKHMKQNDKGEMIPVHPNASQVQVVRRKIKDVDHVFLIDKSKLTV